MHDRAIWQNQWRNCNFLPAAKVNNLSSLKTSKFCLSEGLWKRFQYLGLQFGKLKGIGKNLPYFFIVVWKMCMCCYKAGDATSIFSSRMRWQKLNSLPHNVFSYLHICLFVISVLVRCILLKVLPMLQLWLGRISVFPNIVWDCRVRSHIIHRSCAMFPSVTPLSPPPPFDQRL